jgi:hypothetical protein
MGTATIALCPACRHDTLPQLAQPSWHREKHRATQAEREPAPDPRAERIKARKARKTEQSQLRKQLRVKGILAAAKFFLDLKAQNLSTSAPSEDCPRCQKLQGAA